MFFIVGCFFNAYICCRTLKISYPAATQSFSGCRVQHKSAQRIWVGLLANRSGLPLRIVFFDGNLAVDGEHGMVALGWLPVGFSLQQNATDTFFNLRSTMKDMNRDMFDK